MEKKIDVMSVDGALLETRVEHELHLRRQAGHLAFADGALGERKVAPRSVRGELARGRFGPERAVEPVPVDADKIDAVASVVFQQTPVGHPHGQPMGLDDSEPERPKCSAGNRELVVEVVDHDIEVVVVSGLPTGKGIDAPAPCEPAAHAARLGRLEDPHHVGRLDLAADRGADPCEKAQR